MKLLGWAIFDKDDEPYRHPTDAARRGVRVYQTQNKALLYARLKGLWVKPVYCAEKGKKR